VYTVKQLSDLAGVTARTLHYYDEIGLLKPEAVGGNGYRYYGEESLLQLQQILFYRELDLPLEDIRKLMGRHDFDILTALEGHRQALTRRMERLDKLVRTVDDTILHLKGLKEMSQKQLFSAFSEEEQEKYAKDAEQMYDPAIVKASNKKWKAYSAEEKQRINDEGNALYADLQTAMPRGAASPEVQACIARWHRHMQSFWSPNDDQLLGLADLYNDDPRFKANYDNLDPRLAAFMREAVKVYVEKRRKK
jgi:DNA-binding transcriptional MerR regulator